MLDQRAEILNQRRKALNDGQASQETLGFGLVPFVGGLLIAAPEFVTIPLIVSGGLVALKGLAGMFRNARIQRQQSHRLAELNH